MRIASLALLAVATTSCFNSFDTLLPDEDRFSSGASLAYTALGWSGDTLVEGTIVVVATDSGSFSGTWSSHWAPGADTSVVVGGQLGTGTATGQLFAGGGLRMVVTDGDSTTEVILSGARDALGWHGRWGTAASGGVRTGGSFTAVLLP